jgi:hypothetical protein
VLAAPARAAAVAAEARRTVLRAHSADGLVQGMETFYCRLIAEEGACVSW